jgi:transcriptional regulator with XRE-family HTH domain
MELVTKKEFAEMMGVTPQYISKIKNKLRLEKKIQHTEIELVVLCQENIELFKNPSENRGGDRKKKGGKNGK